MSYVMGHHVPITLGEGRTIGPDDSVGRIDPKHETNRRHIEAGRLIEVKAKSKSTSKEEK